jgi:hypothetical protein
MVGRALDVHLIFRTSRADYLRISHGHLGQLS